MTMTPSQMQQELAKRRARAIALGEFVQPQMKPSGAPIPVPARRPIAAAGAPASPVQAAQAPAIAAQQAVTPQAQPQEPQALPQMDPGIDRRSGLANYLMQEGFSNDPVEHWVQGVGRMAKAGLGAYLGNRADAERAAYNQKLGAALKGNAEGLGMDPALVNAMPGVDAKTGIGLMASHAGATRDANIAAQQDMRERLLDEDQYQRRRGDKIEDFRTQREIMAETGTAPGTNVEVNPSTTISPEAASASIKVDQKQMEGMLTAAQQAQSMVPQLEQMIRIVESTPTGFGQEAMLPIKRMAAGLGIDVPNLSDQEVLNSLVQEIVPRMRPPGSGASSDMETRSFQTAVGGLGSTQQANIVRWTGMKQVAERTKAEYELMREYYDDPELGNGSLRGFSGYVDEKLGKLFPTPKNEDEWSTIPQGTLYVDPNGDYRVKR